MSDAVSWQAFLKFAGHNYRLPFDEQILVYAQRPDATAVLPIEAWNKSFHRMVNRGSKGIAVFDKVLSGGRQRLKYYFDISDTHPHERFPEKQVPLWSMEAGYEKEVTAALENAFGELERKESFGEAVLCTAETITGDNLADYYEDLRTNTGGSFLADMDGDNLRVCYRQAVTASVAYMLMNRLGIKPEDFLEPDDFAWVFDFNTADTVNALGTATFDFARMALDEAARTVRALQREETKTRTFAAALGRLYNQQKEKEGRSGENDGHGIHDAGRLPVAGSGVAGAERSKPGKIRKDEGELPEKTQESDIHQPAGLMQTDGTPGRDGAERGGAAFAAYGGDESTGADNGGTESQRSVEVDGDDEQHQAGGGGNRLAGTDLQLEYHDRKTEDKSLPFFGSDEDIRAILRTTPHLKAGRDEIRRFYENTDDDSKRTEYIKEIFNNDYTELSIGGGRRAGYKTYQNVLHLWEGTYDERTKESYYDWGVISEYVDSLRIRGELYDAGKPLPSMEGQLSLLDEPRQEKPFAITQEVVDVALCRGSLMGGSKFRIYEQFEKSLSAKENIKFLKNEYGWGGSPIKAGLGIREMHNGQGIELSTGYSSGDERLLLKWAQVEKRIRELIRLGRYLNSKEKQNYPAWLEERQEKSTGMQAGRQEEAPLAQKLAELAELSAPYDFHDDFSYHGDAGKEAEAFQQRLGEKAFATGLMHRISQYMEIAEKAGDTEFVGKAGEISEELERLFPEYSYSLGDKVYIGSTEYEILSLGEDAVRLYDSSCPLINREMGRSEFDEKVEENPANRHLIIKREPQREREPAAAGKENGDASKAKLDEAGRKAGKETRMKPAGMDSMPQPGEEKSQPPAEEEIKPSWERQPGVQKSRVLYPEIKDADRRNYRITNDELGHGGKKEKFAANLDAIRMLKHLEQEGRLAGEPEQVVLSGYVGWGGLAEAFDAENASWAEEYQKLKSILTDGEYEKARESTLTAFYTPPVIMKAMYGVLARMGFKKGNILEPSCGTGNFMGLLPDGMSESRLYGVELDEISGRIARQLYQKASIAIEGYEKTSLPDSFFDAAIGNVPFGDFRAADKKYDKHGFYIHDYFFAKTLDKVRPGGVIAFITSSGTMDKANPAARKYIAQRAELLGAVRLPETAFLKNAGTTVTADILFFQKCDKPKGIGDDWVYTDRDENGIAINRYFTSHPEMVIGRMVEKNGRFGKETACVLADGMDFQSRLIDAMERINGQIPEYEFEGETEAPESIPADFSARNFSYADVDGKLYFREDSVMVPVSVSAAGERRIKSLISIRESVRNLIGLQMEGRPDAEIKAEQERLNRLYDAFSKKYGLINSRANNAVFSQDSSYYLLCALEILDEEGNLKRKADMFTKRTIRADVEEKRADTPSDALALSIGEKAGVDMPYMEGLLGKTEAEIARELEGVIFLEPEKYMAGERAYQTADEYLSGNVREKLRTAQRIAEREPAFRVNVAALEKVQPVDLSASEISVRLGATWIPEDVVRQFIFELLETPEYIKQYIDVRLFRITKEWNITGKSKDQTSIKAYSTYGTGRINAYKIIENTLNLRDVKIFDYENVRGEKISKLNVKETAIARAKQEQIKEAFKDWIWRDGERRKRLTKLYNEQFNSDRAREYDGQHIRFSGMNPEITLKPHQVNAVARILYGGNTLLAHVVGAGKTFEMAAAAMESKRLGLCSKSLFVVPNHLTEQWAAEFFQLYPAANLLVATKKGFEKKNRRKFCARIATGDFDAIIIGHSQFEKIPVSIERQQSVLRNQLDEIIDGIGVLKRERGEKFQVRQMEKTRKHLQTKLSKLNDQGGKDDVVTFEELGVDRLFIDESHYYKNLFLYTKMRNVGGIAQTEAQKSSDLFLKCRYLDELTGGKGVIFATGTPVSNSMAELYTIQRYLQYDLLEQRQIQHFDAWASSFGETVTTLELAPEGTGYRTKTRFAKFYNLPELMTMFRQVADIQTADMLNLPVPDAAYVTETSKPTGLQQEMVGELSERAERVRKKMVGAQIDNMLKITNDGRKLALDQRLMNGLLADEAGTKVNLCVENIYRVWKQGERNRAAQLVFCDLSTPKNDGTFNVYDDIRQKLLSKGVPEGEIRFIHEAGTETKKKELFARVRKGDVRVLLGSTQKMGAGTNVQDRLIAIHDLDCPWRPSDLEQRAGRIIRQGNQNPEVEICRYVTESTFDAYLWQLVENKQKFISQIMSSKSPVRTAEDIDETALSYAEIKMLATGNPMIKEKMDLDNKVSELKVLKQSFLSQKYYLQDRLSTFYPMEIKRFAERLEAYEKDIAFLGAQPESSGKFFCGMEIKGAVFSEKKAAGEAILLACKEMKDPAPVPLGAYRGFSMHLSFDTKGRTYDLALKNEMTYKASLGMDAAGNITRIDNALDSIPDRLEETKRKLDDTIKQKENAELEVKTPFVHEEELASKMKRLEELNVLLDAGKGQENVPDAEAEAGEAEEKDRPQIEAER